MVLIFKIQQRIDILTSSLSGEDGAEDILNRDRLIEKRIKYLQRSLSMKKTESDRPHSGDFSKTNRKHHRSSKTLSQLEESIGDPQNDFNVTRMVVIEEDEENEHGEAENNNSSCRESMQSYISQKSRILGDSNRQMQVSTPLYILKPASISKDTSNEPTRRKSKSPIPKPQKVRAASISFPMSIPPLGIAECRDVRDDFDTVFRVPLVCQEQTLTFV